MEALITDLAGQGLLGLVTAIAVFVAYKKDRQVTALYDRLLEKSSKTAEKYHSLASELQATIKELHDSLDHDE